MARGKAAYLEVLTLLEQTGGGVHDREKADVFLRLADLAIGAEEYKKAYAQAGRAVGIAPGMWRGHYLQGVAALKLGQFLLAVCALEEADVVAQIQGIDSDTASLLREAREKLAQRQRKDEARRREERANAEVRGSANFGNFKSRWERWQRDQKEDHEEEEAHKAEEEARRQEEQEEARRRQDEEQSRRRHDQHRKKNSANDSRGAGHNVRAERVSPAWQLVMIEHLQVLGLWGAESNSNGECDTKAGVDVAPPEPAASLQPQSLPNLLHSLQSAAVTRAFRKRALTNHPDKGGTKEAFQRLTRAYEAVLACIEN